eukprot:4686721-Amphidinium_carterae.1
MGGACIGCVPALFAALCRPTSSPFRSAQCAGEDVHMCRTCFGDSTPGMEPMPCSSVEKRVVDIRIDAGRSDSWGDMCMMMSATVKSGFSAYCRNSCKGTSVGNTLCHNGTWEFTQRETVGDGNERERERGKVMNRITKMCCCMTDWCSGYKQKGLLLPFRIVLLQAPGTPGTPLHANASQKGCSAKDKHDNPSVKHPQPSRFKSALIRLHNEPQLAKYDAAEAAAGRGVSEN